MASSVFDDRREAHLPWQVDESPRKESVRDVATQIGELIRTKKRGRIVAQIVIELVHVSPRFAVSERKQHLLAIFPVQLGHHFELAVSGSACAIQNECVVAVRRPGSHQHDAAGVAVLVANTQMKCPGNGVLQLECPGFTVWSKITGNSPADEQRKTASQ